ncbi:MAG: 5'/3'-nucleotidase SurE [Anaerolineae bacterium]|nr:5'/3'-nucleotidase SurE [Chloroflexota bacterium]MBP6297923.1 5'/3'-nucleotidase SurE [Anaerolineae bacterium]
MTSQRPLILFTNDDGIDSPGLWASAGAFIDIADILIVAPIEQQSGTGRSLPISSRGNIVERELMVGGQKMVGYGVGGTPAQAVQHGVYELAGRWPALVVSGINYGENVGNGVTISGTVGAALEAACLGIPSVAVSLQVAKDLHLSYSREVNFSAAAYFTRFFGEWLLNSNERPDDVEVLKIEVPQHATPDTEWKVTRVSKKRLFWPVRPARRDFAGDGYVGYAANLDPSTAEPDSDIYTVLHQGLVSVSPVSFDLTARTDRAGLREKLNGGNALVTGAVDRANGKHRR